MSMSLIPTTAKLGSGASTVAVSMVTGWETAGYIGTVAGALVALIALYVTISMNGHQKRREYEKEIQDAFDRGVKSIEPDLHRAERDAEFFRSLVFSREEEASQRRIELRSLIEGQRNDTKGTDEPAPE